MAKLPLRKPKKMVCVLCLLGRVALITRGFATGLCRLSADGCQSTPVPRGGGCVDQHHDGHALDLHCAEYVLYGAGTQPVSAGRKARAVNMRRAALAAMARVIGPITARRARATVISIAAANGGMPPPPSAPSPPPRP